RPNGDRAARPSAQVSTLANSRSVGSQTGRGGRVGKWVPGREIVGLGSRINYQHFDQVGDLAKMVQGVARGLVVAAHEIHVEDILPWPPTHGSRLNFVEADVA